MSVSILPSEGIRKVRMVEDIEKLRAELGAESFFELPILGYREVPVAEARVAERVAAHGAESSDGGGNHCDAAVLAHVTTERFSEAPAPGVVAALLQAAGSASWRKIRYGIWNWGST